MFITSCVNNTRVNNKVNNTFILHATTIIIYHSNGSCRSKTSVDMEPRAPGPGNGAAGPEIWLRMSMQGVSPGGICKSFGCCTNTILFLQFNSRTIHRCAQKRTGGIFIIFIRLIVIAIFGKIPSSSFLCNSGHGGMFWACRLRLRITLLARSKLT